MNEIKLHETRRAIGHIKNAVSMIVNDEMSNLSLYQDIWDDGIHIFMDKDTIPFKGSFDELEVDNMSEEGYYKLQNKMIVWLGKCLANAHKELKKIQKHKKAKAVCLRFVKAGSVTVEVPNNWDKMTDTEKREWADEELENTDTELLYDSLRNDEDKVCEAIENVEDGYTHEIPPTDLWKAYKS
jgi:hypothetical protein